MSIISDRINIVRSRIKSNSKKKGWRRLVLPAAFLVCGIIDFLLVYYLVSLYF